jgi:hypothetical protein
MLRSLNDCSGHVRPNVLRLREFDNLARGAAFRLRSTDWLGFYTHDASRSKETPYEVTCRTRLKAFRYGRTAVDTEWKVSLYGEEVLRPKRSDDTGDVVANAQEGSHAALQMQEMQFLAHRQ